MAIRATVKGREAAGSFAFCLPALAFYLFFYVYPAVSGVWYSMTDWTSMKNGMGFIGLGNFAQLFRDRDLLRVLSTTVTYTLVMCAVQNSLGLLLALAVDSRRTLGGMYRAIVFLPFILPTVVSSNIWAYLYNPLNGLFTVISTSLGGGTLDVLGNPRTALAGVMGTNLWQLTGFSMILYYAGLQSIPESVIDSARVDGVGPLASLASIKLPMIVPAVTINVTYSLINGLKVFDYIYLMTGGGPGKTTQTISAEIYFTAFNKGFFGYASAMGVLLFLLIAVVSFLFLALVRRREVEA